VVDALQLGLLVAQVTQGGLVGDRGLVQLGLEVQAEAVQLLDALLQIAGGVVGLKGNHKNGSKYATQECKPNSTFDFFLCKNKFFIGLLSKNLATKNIAALYNS